MIEGKLSEDEARFCGQGLGVRCCVYLSLDHNGFHCLRELNGPELPIGEVPIFPDSDHYSIDQDGFHGIVMPAAERHPTLPFPSCQLDLRNDPLPERS